ncbi:guanylate kinase [candidate division KSB1 bacterium]|nr:guanylate kinase [candidate division KSB1 bacterium]
MKNGLLVILSSPSGGGKTTILNALRKQQEIEFVYSISATTRAPRPGEVDGKHYYFLSEDQFQKKVADGEFYEWEQVHQYHYGTLRAPIEAWLREGKIVLLDIDVNGELNVKKQLPEQTISIFIAPPSEQILIERLKNRKTESPEEIDRRLRRLPMEMNKKDQYDYVLINEDLDTCVNQVIEVIKHHIQYEGGNIS